MQAALDRKVSLEEASNFFESDQTIENQELRRYVESMVWEIDGSPDYFVELLNMFKARKSEEQFIQYLNS